jgi:[methyl-Co(III) methanol-specific corrinoid protein]:coenzyme M methyltransferase
MMNAAIVDVMNVTGHTLPEAHHEAGLMSQLAVDVHQNTGFENIGVPFCMTVEAEALGSEINFGTLSCEPKIAREVYSSVTQVPFHDPDVLTREGRIARIAGAIGQLALENPEVPVLGNLTGPISTAASVVDPITLLKELRKDPANAHRFIDYVSDFLIKYAGQMVEHGVTAISIADPTATGEILGPKIFGEYAVRYLHKVILAIHQFGVPVILHICGNLNTVKHLIPSITANAISTDALVNLKLLKSEFPELITMGNLSTYLLEWDNGEKVAEQTVRLVRDGVEIIAPACGLSTATPLDNIKALTATVKEG